MQEAIITTIIPTYKRAHKLKKSIESVQKQTFREIRIVVLDDASNDETKEVVFELQKHDSRIEYVCHEKNLGSNQNFAFGLRCVQTPFYSFLSDDDVLLEGFYELALHSLDSHPEAALFMGNTLVVDDSKRVVAESLRTALKDGIYIGGAIWDEVLNSRSLYWTSILFRKDAIVGGLDVLVPLIDIDYVLRFMLRFPIVISTQPCAIFHTHENSLSFKGGFSFYHDGILMIMKKIEEDLSGIEPYLQKKALCFCREAMIACMFSIGVKSALMGDLEHAKKCEEVLSAFEGDKKLKVLRQISYVTKRFPGSRVILHALYTLRNFVIRSSQTLLERV